MPEISLRHHGSLAYREAVPDGTPSGPPVILVHGYPESSRMWAPVIDALAAAGRRCIAPDLYGLGDSGEDAPTTFEDNLTAFTDLIDALEIERAAVVVHDWGGFIGLAWAATHPETVDALVISDTGFFSNGKWHEMGEAMRSEQGEAVVGAIDRDAFAAMLRAIGPFDEAAIDAYWAPFENGRGQRATLDFYRSMDFEKLAPYEGGLAALRVPTLLLWGADDQFAPLAAAKRLERQIPGAELVAIEGAGHFVYTEQPERCAREIVAFLVR